MVEGGRQVFAEDVHGVVRRVGGDGCAQLAERAGSDQAQQLCLRQDSPDQGAEAPGHARLLPFGALQHGIGVEDGSSAVRSLGFERQFLQYLQDSSCGPRAHRTAGPRRTTH